MNYESKIRRLKSGFSVIIITSTLILTSSNAHAFGLSDIRDTIGDAIDAVTPTVRIIYEEGRKAYKVGKPYYRKGKVIARPVYDLYTGNYIGFLDSSNRLIKEF